MDIDLVRRVAWELWKMRTHNRAKLLPMDYPLWRASAELDWEFAEKLVAQGLLSA